jgi:hypothetical protein
MTFQKHSIVKKYYWPKCKGLGCERVKKKGPIWWITIDLSKNHFLDFNSLPMTKIILNKIKISTLIQKLWNNDDTYCLILGFPIVLRRQWGSPWFERVKVWSQTKQNKQTPILIRKKIHMQLKWDI